MIWGQCILPILLFINSSKFIFTWQHIKIRPNINVSTPEQILKICKLTIFITGGRLLERKSCISFFIVSSRSLLFCQSGVIFSGDKAFNLLFQLLSFRSNLFCLSQGLRLTEKQQKCYLVVLKTFGKVGYDTVKYQL